MSSNTSSPLHARVCCHVCSVLIVGVGMVGLLYACAQYAWRLACAVEQLYASIREGEFIRHCAIGGSVIKIAECKLVDGINTMIMNSISQFTDIILEITKSKSMAREGMDDVVDTPVDTPVDSTFADTMHVGYMDPLSSLPADPEAAGRAMRLRVEYETVTRLPGERDVSRWILFTVRTHMDALERLDDETCAALLEGITSSDADEP